VNALASDVRPAKDPAEGIPGKSAVVLIDEIDKADPDVPNNLLEALGSHQFPVLDIPNTMVKDKQRPLVIITTNEERELPRAFLRRCIVLHLEAKKVPELVTIATEHFEERTHDTLYEDLAKVLDEQRKKAEELGLRPPSTAEYLDAIAACRALEIAPPDPARAAEVDAESADRIKDRWRYLIEVALSKRRLDDETLPTPEPTGTDLGERPPGADQ
jgi:MoxR-like ATPase